MDTHQVLALIEEHSLVTLPDPDRPHTPGEYISYLGCLLWKAHDAIWNARSNEAGRTFLPQIAALAIAAIEENGDSMGLAVYDRAAIFGMAERFPAPHNDNLTEYLLDIESIVLRYKAHRPQLRAPDAAPKIAANLIEILAIAMAALRDER
jgi:hypothetical protein